MLDKSEHDMTQQQAELIELSTMWDRVCKLSVNKQEKLEQAHKLVFVIQFLEFNLLCLETAAKNVFVFGCLWLVIVKRFILFTGWGLPPESSGLAGLVGIFRETAEVPRGPSWGGAATPQTDWGAQGTDESRKEDTPWSYMQKSIEDEFFKTCIQ